MPGNKKPKRKYKPMRVVEGDPRYRLAHVAAMQSREDLDAEMQRSIGLLATTSWGAFEQGRADEQDLGNLAMVANLSRVLCEQDISDSRSYMPVCDEASAALESVHARHLRVGKIGMAGAERVSIAHLMDLFKELMECAGLTIGILRAALMEVDRRMDIANNQPVTQ